MRPENEAMLLYYKLTVSQSYQLAQSQVIPGAVCGVLLSVPPEAILRLAKTGWMIFHFALAIAYLRRMNSKPGSNLR